MRNFIEINGKKVTPSEMTFNNICKLEDMGISIANAGTHTMILVRGYIALCLHCSLEEAGKEIENHCVGGNDFESILECLSEAMDESGFFQALNKTEKEKTPTVQE